jgi:hypothetical protein
MSDLRSRATPFGKGAKASTCPFLEIKAKNCSMWERIVRPVGVYKGKTFSAVPLYYSAAPKNLKPFLV